MTEETIDQAPHDSVPGLLAYTTAIASAYFSNQHVPKEEISTVLFNIHAALGILVSPGTVGAVEPEPTKKQEPAVSVRKSVTPDHIICLEDGKKLKMLKRHIMTHYGLTPDQYRAKWGLPKDYPMTAPNYAAQRSALAKQIGLGQPSKNAA